MLNKVWQGLETLAGKLVEGSVTMTRRRLVKLALATVPSLALAPPSKAEAVKIEDFRMQPETGWRFFTDEVMGGVSRGQVAFLKGDGFPYARMTGRVSTENRGGFIQMRLDLPNPLSAEAKGVRLVARGNDQRYFVHLRTSGTILPWQYYQAEFDVTRNWEEAILPFDAFRASGALLRTVARPESVKSIAVVAYGRDHEAEIEVREIGFV